ncbi:hypothetical protein SDC9_206510 [bioreactor metagenome]|uniref:Uncharacterized protein n=1 Tax=bioreactor metagenome TaxID=1076179 RepID=A0A645J504_9ZZZZ
MGNDFMAAHLTGCSIRAELKEEGGAFALDAFNLNLAAHLHHDHIGYGQPQTGAAEFARGGGVGLGKGFEELLLLLPADADARIPDRD